MNILLQVVAQLPTDTVIVEDTIASKNFLLATGQNLISVFHNPTSERFTGTVINHQENIWQFSFLLSTIIIVALVRGLYANRMNQFFEAVLVPRHLRQLMREEGFLIHPFSLLLFFNVIVIYSLLTYKTLDYFQLIAIEESGFQLFFWLLLGIFSILFFKIIVLRIMEFLTDTDQGQRENRYSWLFYHQFIGLILILPTGIILFGKVGLIYPTLFIAYFLIIIFLVFRIGKGIFLAITNNVYVLHLFLYLCALEIIPLIVLIKVLVNQITWFTEI